MNIRRVLAAVAAGGVMLLGASVAPAAGAEVYVNAVLGRKVVTYTSYPTDPTPTSKWVASAQGEHVDDNYVTKPDPNALRGRAAVAETFGIKRVRIYDVKLQQLRGGVWQTVAHNPTDKISEAPKAYAVSYTQTRRTCWWDDFTRTYRVVNSHGIRRSDGIVANRTTYSKNFRGPMLADDPECPIGALGATLWGLKTEWSRGERDDVSTELNYFSPPNSPAAGVVARVNFGDGFTVNEVGEGFVADEATADPNDYVYEAGTWAPGRREEPSWSLTATTPGKQTSELTMTSTTPKVLPGRDVAEATITDNPVADVTLDTSLPTGAGWNEDVDPAAAGLQLHPGDRVIYRFDVRNDGPDPVGWVWLHGTWPTKLGDIERAWFTPSGEPASCWIGEFDGQVEFNCDVPRTEADGSHSIYVQTRVDADASAGTVTGTFTGDGDELDPNRENSTSSTSFEVVPEEVS